MDDFIYVLFAAAIFMVFIFILAGVGPWIAPGEYQTQVINFSVGKVGVITDIPTRTDSFGSFVVGEVQEQELRNVPQFMVGTSWLGGNVQSYNIEVPEWYLEDIKDVRITFNVYDTNQYGNLVVVWNGFRVSREAFDKGAQEIVVHPDYVKESNTLQIYAEGPGPRFWASTVYVLRDFRVSVEYGPSRIVPFQTLHSELEAFSKGEITFYATESPNNLEIKVNGVEIYDKVPKGFDSAEFDFVKVPLNSGTNIVSFSSNGYVNLNDVTLNLFLMTNEVVRIKRFNLTEEQFALLNQGYKGRVEFRVETVLRSGNLNVRVNDRIIRVSDISTGWDSITFSRDDVSAGTNEVEFSGTGGFYIDEASVVIGF